jgi:putative methionine-R-sulfoxide reductase with GAF domain
MQQTSSTQITLPWWKQLATRLMFAFQILGVLPVLIVTLVVVNRTGSQARDQVYNQLDSVAELKSDQILRWLDAGNLAMDTLLSGTNAARFANYTAAKIPSAQERAEVSEILAGAVQAEYFKRMFIYSEDGNVVASSDPNEVGKNVKDQPYFNVGLHADYIQSPVLNPSTQQLVMYITRPLRSGKIQATGVLVGELNIDTLADIMTERTGLGKSGETYLVSLQNNNLLTPSRFEGYEMNTAYSSEGINEALKGIKGTGTYDSYHRTTVLGSYRFIPELQAALLSEVEESQALATFRQARLITVFIAVIAALASAVVAILISQGISRPIHTLTVSAERIGAGNLKADVLEVRRQDEIGVLARAFQSMQQELVTIYADLEERVAARTRDLEIVAEVGTATATILESQQLLQEVVDLTKERFHLYHSHIYLLDEKGENLVLTAGAGEAGRIMVAEGRSIPLDREQSLVARAAREQKGVTANDVTQAPDFLPNPLLPDTRSELAVPMIVGGEVIGVFDIQSEQMGRFTDSDVNIQTTLAAQLATSIQNVRSFEQSKKQAELESLVNAIGQKIQRTTSIEETLQTAVRELGTAVGATRVRVNIQAGRES